MARLQADLETIRLAELYATHPLLRAMPVPHMRLPSVDLDVPVLIRESEEPREGETTRGGTRLEDLRPTFDELLNARLLRAGVTLSGAERKRLGAALDEQIQVQEQPIETSVDVNRVAAELTSVSVRFIEEMRATPELEEPALPVSFGEELETAVRLAFLKLRTPPPRLSVMVTTAEIREVGNEEAVTRLRLRVSEEGLEWTSIESEGVWRDRLVPE